VLLPDMHAPELLDSLNAIKPRPFRLVIHSYAGDGPELRRRGADIVLQRPASKEELLQAVQAAMRRQSAQGLGVLLVNSPDLDSRRLCAELHERGHLPIAADSLTTAADRMRQYPVEVVLLTQACLGADWTLLKKLKLTTEDNIHVMILCDTIRRKERRLADSHGVWLLPYRPGREDEIVEFVSAFREPVEVECNA
jgi:DNA-binding response OmpR family regulator